MTDTVQTVPLCIGQSKNGELPWTTPSENFSGDISNSKDIMIGDDAEAAGANGGIMEFSGDGAGDA